MQDRVADEADSDLENKQKSSLRHLVNQLEQKQSHKTGKRKIRGGDEDVPIYKPKVAKAKTEDMDGFGYSMDGVPVSFSFDMIFVVICVICVICDSMNFCIWVSNHQEYSAHEDTEKKEKKRKKEERKPKPVEYAPEPEVQQGERRSASWQILKNRGLTPARKKEDR